MKVAKLRWSVAERDSFGVTGLALLGLILWDFYIRGPGLRPFDILTTLALTAASAGGVGGRFFLSLAGVRRIATVWGLVVLYAVIGTLSDTENARPVLGFLMGVVVFALATMLPIPTRRVIVAATTLCIITLCLAFWLQLVVFDATGVLINYHAWLGGEPRVFGKAFRACGLNLEPAHLAINLFLLEVLRFNATDRIDRIVILAMLSSVASLSLWGIGATAFLIIAKMWRTRAFWICFLLIVLAVLSALPVLDSWWNSFWLAKRVMALGSDSGTSVRYAVLLTSLANLLWEPTTWFGAGITNDYALFGVSGLGFLTRALGLVGLIGFLLGIFLAAPRGHKAFTTAATAMALTATSLWTYMIWWFWLALVMRTFSDTTSQSADWRDETWSPAAPIKHNSIVPMP